MTTPPPQRCRTLPARGALLVSTDLHGNLRDYLALEALFLAALARGEDLRWALLGDLIHGPTEADSAREPHLYGYPDESPALVERLAALLARHPERVLLVLGNHDHGHIGGQHTAKFHEDEVEALEARLSKRERAAMHALFEQAALVLVAPCGALLCHGSPGRELKSLAQLEGPLVLPDDADAAARLRWRALQSVLWSYGQSPSVTNALLARVSHETGLRLHFVLHGHDRDEHGLLVEGENQLQPVLFGALQGEKRYLWLDLSARYKSVRKLREGHEIRRLYPDLAPV